MQSDQTAQDSQLTVSDTTAHGLVPFFSFGRVQSETSQVLPVPLKLLDCPGSGAEHWMIGEAVQHEQPDAQTTCLLSGGLLLVVITGRRDGIAQQTAESYLRAYQLSRKYHKPHLIRTWNYFPDIHRQQDGLENYQHFCVARYDILKQLDQHRVPYPAATAIGSRNDDFTFAFLFSTEQACVIENRRQISAWDYPQQYSPKQPVFSRAVEFQNLLICSGTASVVGHATRHVEDFTAQFREMISNIQVLIDSSRFDCALENGYYKFYLRDHEQLPTLKALIEQHQLNRYMIYEGDICRQSLLLESEVVFS